MLSPAMRYAIGIQKGLEKYFATWLPNQRIMVGDVGEINALTFNKLTTLEELGVEHYYDAGVNCISLDYTSGDDVSITAKSSLSGDDVPLAESSALIAVEFGKIGAYLFKANNGKGLTISNMMSVGKQIIELYKKKVWNRDWVMVSHVISFDSATIMVANSTSAKIKLEAKCEISDDIFSRLKSDSKVNVVHQSGEIIKVIAENGVTPIYQLYGIRRRLFKDTSFAMKSSKADISELESENSNELRTNDGFEFGPIIGRLQMK